MGSGVCSLWGWGLVWFTPTFLLRTYGLNVAQAGSLMGRIHLVGGVAATVVAAWLMSRPFMLDPRRSLWTLGWVTGCATILSIIAYWTHSLWLARVMLWAYVPAIYFFIGPCMALVLNLAPSHMRSTFTAWSVLVGNVFNLIVAVQGVGILSDWFGGAHGSDAASLRWALLVLAPTGFWATWHFFLGARTVVPEMRRAVGYGSPSAVIPTARGEFLTTCYDSGSIGRISADGKELPPYTHDKDGKRFVGPNDFAPDRHGGIYFTCSGTAPGPVIDGKIFYIAPDDTISQKATDIHSANGIVVSNDGKTLYAIETEDHRLIQFKIGPGGSLSER